MLRPLFKFVGSKKEVCGPPVYLTTDWTAAYESVERLAALGAETAICGHGTAMQGAELKEGLDRLVTNWKETALPEHGKWVRE